MKQAQVNNFSDILFSRAAADPKGAAYHFFLDKADSSQDISLEELALKVKAIAASLQHRNLKGERVMLAFAHGPEFIYAFYACMALGAIAVPVTPPSRNKVDIRLESVFRDARPTLVLSNEALLEVFQNKVDYGEQAAPEILSLAGLDSAAEDFKPVSVGGEDIAFLQYTSGSTGDPKGVMVSHANLLCNSELIADACRSGSHSGAVIWLPFYHDMGLIGGVLHSMYTGTSAHLMSPVSFIQQPMRWLQRMSDTRSTIAVAPNFALELCCDKATEEQLQSLDLSALECVLCGAEPVNANTVKRFSETFARCGFKHDAFMPSYGLAEATLYVSGTLHDGTGPKILTLDSSALAAHRIENATDESRTQELIGNGMLGQRVCIANPDTLEALGDDKIGEIWVTGESVSRGYWQREELNKKAFGIKLSNDANSPLYYRTGDLGFSRNGELFINGRIKDLIIVRGKNHYPQDLEDSATRAHELLITGAAAAFSVDEGNGEQLVLVAEVSRQAVRLLKDESKAREVIDTINRAINSRHELLPIAICLVKPARVLKTSSGKIQRNGNKQSWLADDFDAIYAWKKPVIEATVVDTGEPLKKLRSRADIERWLLEQLAVRSGLAVHEIELGQSFSNYGLDSMAAIELVGQINERLEGREAIDPTELWNYPTVESLLDYLYPSSQSELEAEPSEQGDTEETDLAAEAAALRALLGD